MKSTRIIRIGQYVWAAVIIAIVIFPIYWIFVSAFKTKAEIISYAPSLFPKTWTLDNFQNALQNYNIGMYFKNSLIVTISTVFFSIVIASLCSYALTFFKMRIGPAMERMLIALQVLPSVTMVLPLFIIYSKLSLSNTYLSLIITYIASVTGTPIAVVLLNGYFKDIPLEVFESAEIDGASTLQAFVKILLPLGAPGLVCTAIYIFVLTWQEFMFAVNLITDSEMFTMPVGLQMFVGEYSTDWGSMMAASVIISVPAIILFVSVQNFFIDNIAGAIKG